MNAVSRRFGSSTPRSLGLISRARAIHPHPALWLAVLPLLVLACAPPADPRTADPSPRATSASSASPAPDRAAPELSEDRVPTAALAESTNPPPPTLEALPEKVANVYEGPSSPDGKWRLLTLHYDEHRRWPQPGGDEDHYMTYYAQVIAATAGDLTRTIRAGWLPDGLGAPSPQTLGWSDDSASAYVFTGASADGCGIGMASEEILRYDLADGRTRAIGAGPGRPTLALGGRAIAYTDLVGPGRGELLLLDTDSGEKRRWPFPLTIPGTPDGTWSQGPLLEGVSVAPDGSGAIAEVHYGVCQDDWRNALVHLDLVTGQATELVPDDGAALLRRVVGWPGGGEVLIAEHPPFTSYPTEAEAVAQRVALPAGR